jgi:MFS family permease
LPAIILAFSISKGHSRTDTIVKTSLALGLPLLICFVMWVYVKHQSIGLTAFNSVMHSTNNALSAYLAGLHFNSMGEQIYLLNEDSVETVASLLMNIVPAAFIVCCNIVAFLANNLILTLYKINNLMAHVSTNAKRFKLSTVSAIIFILAYTAILLFSNDFDTLFWAVVAQNIYLILLAPFAYVGTIAIISRIVSFERRKKNLLFLLIAGVFLFAPVMLIITAYVGVFHTLFNNRKRTKIEK